MILTSDTSLFVECGAAIPVVAVNPPPELLPRTGLIRTRVFRSVLAKARSGSAFGRALETAAKLGARRFRSLSNPLSGRRPKRAPILDESTVRSSLMYLRLVDEHRRAPIDRLVLFDVFDLPVALTFARDHGIEVLVR